MLRAEVPPTRGAFDPQAARAKTGLPRALLLLCAMAQCGFQRFPVTLIRWASQVRAQAEASVGHPGDHRGELASDATDQIVGRVGYELIGQLAMVMRRVGAGLWTAARDAL